MGFKNHALFLWWWPTRPKLSDNVTSLSQQCSFYYFYRKFFRKTFFHQNLGCFCNILIGLVVPSQRLVCPGLVCSQASQGLLDSTVCIFCCALEKMSLRLEFQATIPFSCELTPSSSLGRVAGNRLFWLRPSPKRPQIFFSNTH